MNKQKALTTPVTTQFQRDVMARYGFSYDARNNPPVIPFPQAKPLYGIYQGTEAEMLIEHGEWCLKRCYNPRYREELEAQLAEHRKALELERKAA